MKCKPEDPAPRGLAGQELGTLEMENVTSTIKDTFNQKTFKTLYQPDLTRGNVQYVQLYK